MSAPGRGRRLGLFALLLTLGGSALLVGSSGARLWAENHLPVGALYAAFNRLRPQLNQANGAECFERLRELGVPGRPLSQELMRRENSRERDCPIVNGFAMRWPLAEKRYVTCALAEALYRFYQVDLVPASVRRYGQPVVWIEDAGVRSCRNMSGHRHLRSEHAYANAIDLRAFVLGDGRTIEVASHWDDPEHAAFLREVAAAACARFHVVLTPDSNEDHQDHIHADLGLWKHCE